MSRLPHGEAPRLFVALAFLVLSALAPPAPASAQGDGWSAEGEVGAALFFGNTSQTTLSSRLAAAVADSAREFSAAAAFSYGEAENDDGQTFVSKRSWKLGADYTHRPLGRISPFVSGEVEQALERRIDLRYSLGAGGKFLVHRSESAQVDLSVSVLAEETQPRGPGNGGPAEDELLARWAGRLRASKEMVEGRVNLSTENRYRPEFDGFGNFTFTSTSSIAFQLTEVLSLKMTFVDEYDSGAKDRGARTNNDGQLLFSVLSRF